MFKKMRDNFVTGIVIILPAAVTIWLLALVYNAISNNILNPLLKFIEPFFFNPFIAYAIKIALLCALIALVIIIGSGMRVLFIRKLFSTGEAIFFRIPMIGKVYVSIKEMSKAILGERKGIFKSVVLVEYPRKGIYSIGFITVENRKYVMNKQEKTLTSVFMPSTPNPTTGFLILVPQEEVITLDISIEDAIKIVIFGGVTSQDKLMDKNAKPVI